MPPHFCETEAFVYGKSLSSKICKPVTPSFASSVDGYSWDRFWLTIFQCRHAVLNCWMILRICCLSCNYLLFLWFRVSSLPLISIRAWLPLFCCMVPQLDEFSSHGLSQRHWILHRRIYQGLPSIALIDDLTHQTIRICPSHDLCFHLCYSLHQYTTRPWTDSSSR